MMRAATGSQRARLATLTHELETIRIDAPSPVDRLFSDARDLLGTDSIGVYAVAETAHGWQFDRYYVHGDPHKTIAEGMLRLFSRPHVPVLFYDLACPAPAQRNRLVEATAMIDATHPGGWKATPLYREVLVPFGIGDLRQHRMLLCDHGSLLAWFGAFHDGPLSTAQRRIMHAIARPLRRRYRTERRLGCVPRGLAALDAALDHIGAPAFVVRASGSILTVNTEGRRLLGESRDLVRSLHDALRGRPTSISFDLTELRDNGLARCWLAVARPSPEVVLATALARATTLWQLTRRQQQVLGLVIHGHTNETIAAELRLSARAVEMHISALFARASVASRAALVSAALLQ